MAKSNKPFAQMEGFCICEGTVEGIVHIATSPYKDMENINSNTILVLDYPASTFLRLMSKAGGVVADKGTNKIETSKFLSKLGKVAFFGAGKISAQLLNGVRIRLEVASNNTAKIFFI